MPQIPRTDTWISTPLKMATFKKREQKIIKIPMFKILKNQFSRMDKFFETGTVNFKIIEYT
jgi:hypothetical protein